MADEQRTELPTNFSIPTPVISPVTIPALTAQDIASATCTTTCLPSIDPERLPIAITGFVKPTKTAYSHTINTTVKTVPVVPILTTTVPSVTLTLEDVTHTVDDNAVDASTDVNSLANKSFVMFTRLIKAELEELVANQRMSYTEYTQALLNLLPECMNQTNSFVANINNARVQLEGVKVDLERVKQQHEGLEIELVNARTKRINTQLELDVTTLKRYEEELNKIKTEFDMTVSLDTLNMTNSVNASDYSLKNATYALDEYKITTEVPYNAKETEMRTYLNERNSRWERAKLQEEINGAKFQVLAEKEKLRQLQVKANDDSIATYVSSLVRKAQAILYTTQANGFDDKKQQEVISTLVDIWTITASEELVPEYLMELVRKKPQLIVDDNGDAILDDDGNQQFESLGVGSESDIEKLVREYVDQTWKLTDVVLEGE